MPLLVFRKILACSLLCLALLGAGRPALASSSALLDWPTPAAEAVYVMEANSGEVVFSVNGETPLPPASTGKVITALLTLDLLDDLNEKTTITAKAAAVEEMSLYLREGEVLSIADLLKGALVRSGNDACYAIAEAVAGSEPLFVHWLNMKAAVMGAHSATLKNTNGLPAEGHQISAADLARITAACFGHAFFRETVASKQVTLGEGSSRRSYKNTNKLLWQDSHIVGVKTGTTDAAGPCLITAYADGAALFLSVVLHSPNRYGESLTVLRHAANNYTLLRPVVKGQCLAFWPGEDGGLLYAAEDVSFLVKTADMAAVRAVWQLPQRLCFEDAAGNLLGATDLLPKADQNPQPQAEI